MQSCMTEGLLVKLPKNVFLVRYLPWGPCHKTSKIFHVFLYKDISSDNSDNVL